MVLISGFVFSVDYVFESVFKQHHRDRFNILLGKEVDMKGIGYNTNQSEIAIGSGGWFGKGFLEGTQTKGGFVPEQHTDYIFTTVGEEWGFLGSLVVIALFVGLIFRIIYLAERQKTKFSRVYGYCVAYIIHSLFCEYCHGCWDFSNDWSSASVLFVWWLRTLGLYHFAVYLFKDGCE
jgi:rod shape determining protein RodA